jgi:5-methylthioadenosine/S-adenosylhomocysteine deaminase
VMMFLLKNVQYLNSDMKFENGDLLIKDGQIVPLTESEAQAETMDCSDYLVIPGLINGHFHSYSSMAKGLPKEMEIQDWCNETEQGHIQKLFFDYLDNQISQEEFLLIAQQSYIEMVKNGITFVSDADPGDNPFLLSNAINEVGLRGIVDTYDKIADYHDKTNKNVVFGTHLLEEEDFNEELLSQCEAIKESYDSILMTHCLENEWRNDLVQSKYQKSSLELYEERGLLGAKTVLFHGVYMSEQDIDIAARNKASVVHCPISNLWSGAGAAPVKQMLEKEVNVCLGTDFASTDIWEVMRMAYYLLKLNSNVNRFTAEDIFKMATVNGAKAYQLHDKVGQIKNGYQADLVFIKKDSLLFPLIDHNNFSTILHNLLMNCNSSLIDHVMIGGKWVMKDRSLLTINEEKVKKGYIEIIKKFITKLTNDSGHNSYQA